MFKKAGWVPIHIAAAVVLTSLVARSPGAAPGSREAQATATAQPTPTVPTETPTVVPTPTPQPTPIPTTEDYGEEAGDPFDEGAFGALVACYGCEWPETGVGRYEEPCRSSLDEPDGPVEQALWVDDLEPADVLLSTEADYYFVVVGEEEGLTRYAHGELPGLGLVYPDGQVKVNVSLEELEAECDDDEDEHYHIHIDPELEFEYRDWL